MEKAIDNFMYKGKHVAPGMKLEVDAKDIPKLRGMGKIETPPDIPPRKIYGTAPDKVIEDDFQEKPAKKKGRNVAFVPQEVKDEAIKAVEKGKRPKKQW